MTSSSLKHTLLTLATLFICIAISAHTNNNDDIYDILKDTRWTDIDPDLLKVSKENLKTQLNELARCPHVGGMERDLWLADYIKKEWINYGLDTVDINEYQTLQSYPDAENPNTIQIFDGNNLLFTSHYTEDIDNSNKASKDEGLNFDKQMCDQKNVAAYLAYTPPGVAEGDVVYVNYGTLVDFAMLTTPGTMYTTNLQDKICIMRMGNIFRGSKVQNAADNGCSAAIIYNDPRDAAGLGTDPSQVYPNNFFLPPTGAGRGNSRLGKGDPETPTWPSLPGVYRLEGEDLLSTLPSIPTHTIGYGDAFEIFSRLQGVTPPADWTGAPSFPYTIGGSFSPSCGAACRMVLTSHNSNQRTPSHNVVGYIHGREEPDRYIIFGSHRDALSTGAIDPSSGNAQQMEVARILGDKVKNSNWRPRRTIIFANWANEEFGLVGSREFLEEFASTLNDRTVLYINQDVCIAGLSFFATASPSVRNYMFSATHQVPSPLNASESIYDQWLTWSLNAGRPAPETALPASNTDAAFPLFMYGIPAVESAYLPDSNIYPDVKAYPMYHSSYETLDLVERILDPGYNIHEACARLNLVLIKSVADPEILDFTLENYVTQMQNGITTYTANGAIALMNQNGIDTSTWISSISSFQAAVTSWRTRLTAALATKVSGLSARILNDQMSKLERSFLIPQGLPDRPDFRHAIIGSSKYNTFVTYTFPGISDLTTGKNGVTGFYGYEGQELADRIKALKMHVSDLVVVLKQASDFLNDVGSTYVPPSSGTHLSSHWMLIFLVTLFAVNRA